MNKTLKTLFTGLLFSIVVLSNVNSQELTVINPENLGFSSERLNRIDDVFTSYVENNKMAGSVILIARKGQVGYYKAFGKKDIASNSPMGKDAIFRIASQSKAIISVGIMLLQEEGKLLIQEPVSKYIPEFKKTTVAVPNEDGSYKIVKANREITIRDLLNHTSGIGYGNGVAKDKWAEAGIQGWYFADRDEPIAKTIERMATLPMDAQPGTKWVYGYSVDILGVVAERASGMPLDEFLNKKIFTPLGMNDTYFYLPKEKADRLATVYSPTEDGIKPAPQKGTMNSQGHYVDGPRKSFSGGAGLLSTAKDYYLFLQMMANGGELNSARILSPRTVELMTINHVPEGVNFRNGEGFGLGFEVVTDQGRRGTYGSLGQYGWGGAYHSTYWVDPAEELVVVYFTQLRPNSPVRDHLKLRALIYQALID